MRIKDILGIKKDLKKSYPLINENQLRLVSKVAELINHSLAHSASNKHTQAIRSMYNRQLKSYDGVLFAHNLITNAESLSISDFKSDQIDLNSLPEGVNGVAINLDFEGFANEQFSDVSSNLVSNIMVVFTPDTKDGYVMQLVKFVMRQGWQSSLYQIHLDSNFMDDYLSGKDLEPKLSLIIDNEKLIPTGEHMVKELRRSILSFAMVLKQLQMGGSVSEFGIKLDKARTIKILEQ